MVRVTDEVSLSPEHVTLYQATDPLLGHLPVLIFHGASTTANYTLNSSRVQVHIYSPAGFQSFPRITISPNSPFYSVVNYLPREFQGDELYRGLAFGLFKYFTELPDAVKSHLRQRYPGKSRRPGSAPDLFDEKHAAEVAQEMVRSDHTADAIRSLQAALQTQHITSVDVDFVLPPGTIVPLQPEDFEDVPDNEEDIMDPTLRQYVGYSPLVKLLGDPVFLPTSRLRRAPSRPTSLNRTKSFTRDQKRDLRMKMCELVETEERYVAKLNELVRHTADEFRQNAKKRLPHSLSPSEKELEQLFPRSADEMLIVNTAFMHELRRIMDDTETDASHDMDAGGVATATAAAAAAAAAARTTAKDPSGALAVARTFLEWFPRFTACYQDYIRASQHFPQLLNSFLDQPSSFKQRVLQRGEQTIRSVLIEPVQRLPRYSLLIDQIINCLPITHPALQPMLRARDIITNICSMDDPLPDKPHLAHRLRNMVENWPADLEPRGRLILAVDFVELPPPFRPSSASSEDLVRAGMFLVFAETVVLVNKLGGAKFTGRDLVREIDKPSPAGLLVSMTNAAGGPASYELSFGGWHDLADVRFTESADGGHAWMASTRDMKGALGVELGVGKRPTLRYFALQEQFHGRAVRFAEDVVKARVESRFSEAERENPCWTLRAARMPDTSLGLFAAVFQEGAEQLVDGRKEPAAVRVVVDHERGTKGAPIGHYGVEIVVSVSTAGGSSLRRVSMLTAGLNGRQFSDDVELEDFLPTLTRRVIQLLSTQFGTSNPNLVPSLVSYHTKVLKSLTLSTRAEKTRSFLGTSPVKLLSNLWNGTSDSGGSKSTRTPVTALFPPIPTLPRSNSQQSVASVTGKEGTRLIVDGDKPENPLVRLEQTFTGYVAALQVRKGAVIGRSLLNRSMVDELTVNDLYNRLIESPYDFDASADVPVEVIFVAFEKFLRIAWCEQMGPVMSIRDLDTLQERISKRVPGDFADFVNYLFRDMSPQNRRAFTALIKLLADLLEGCGNDGDRGALTVAFAELLVYDSTAHNYINLLDRLVEDCDRIFEEVGYGSGHGPGPGPSSAGGGGGSAYESVNSTTRPSKSQTGSVTSNASSLRRKLGFDTLLRQNSKNSDPERPSMWRTLSKHARHPATGDASHTSSLTKASVSRSRSIDMGHAGPNKLVRRPSSRDRPPVSGAFDDSVVTRPGSSSQQQHHRQLETIGEPDHEYMLPPKSPRKKRRSSLSDLRSLLEAATIDNEEAAAAAAAALIGNLPTKGAAPTINMVSRVHVEPSVLSLPNVETHHAHDDDDDDDEGGADDDDDEEEEATLRQVQVQAHVTDPPLLPLRINKQTPGRFHCSPKAAATTATSRIPVSPTSVGLRTPRQKENFTVAVAVAEPLLHLGSPPTIEAQPPGFSKKAGHGKTISTSNIPTLRQHSRAGPAATATATATAMAAFSPGPPEVVRSSAAARTLNGAAKPAGQRLRLQSPQKLRERLQTEKAAVDEVDVSLQSELTKIAEEMARLNNSCALGGQLPRTPNTPSYGNGHGIGNGAANGSPSYPTATTPSTLDPRKLSAALRALEYRVPAAVQDMRDRQEAMQSDVDATLRAQEAKVRAIDQLYRETVAENELLYEKFNAELAKIVRAVRGKAREDREDLVVMLAEHGEDTARLKKENARLRREMASLRAMVKGGGSEASQQVG